MTIPAIAVQQLNKQVTDATGVLPILSDITLSIAQGETVAITGASGSGKSTLLGLMAGLDVPTSGSVCLLGTELFTLNEDQRAALRARSLGFVFQSFQLLPHLTALENVLLPLELNVATETSYTQKKEQAVQMLARVGLQERLHHYPRTLSGGEQQRVALARAFITTPPLLFADEPTGSLDVATGAAVIELLFSLNREQGSTLILVTHDNTLAARCGRQIRLQAGRLVDA